MIRNISRWSLILRRTTQGIQNTRLPLNRSLSEVGSKPQSNETSVSKKHVNPFAQSDATTGGNTSESLRTDAEREKLLKVLQLEVDIAHQEGRRVPSLEFFQDQHWEHVLTLPTKSARSKYYSYLWQIQMRKESDKRKKLQHAEHMDRRKEELRKEREENNHIIYGLSHTSLFLRIYDSTINHWQNNRLTRAMQFAPKIVLDCSYDKYMNRREATNAAKQLMLCFAENRANDEPFDLHYCNVDLDTISMQGLKRFIPTMLNPEFPMNIHADCFTKLFPKQNLVYLTPHCREDLVEYNPDDVYIVGAMIDTVNNEPLSLAKAKRLGLRMACLPLDRYLQWSAGSGKSLTLNQMINIMLDLKKTGNWEQALRNVPRRKVTEFDPRNDRQHRTHSQRAGHLNVKMDQILNYERQSQRRQVTGYATPEKVRSHKDDMQFNLGTWGSGKKRKNDLAD